MRDIRLMRSKELQNAKKTSHYIFQLSNLHFGAKNVDVAEWRLRALVKSQLSKIELGDSVNFVITGDAVDSPKQTTESVYSNFAEYIEDRCGQKPIRILGNHDINSHGIAFLWISAYSQYRWRISENQYH